MANYRLIAVSILDGSNYECTEWRDFEDVRVRAAAIQRLRWDIHCLVVAIDEGENPYVMSTLLERG